MVFVLAWIGCRAYLPAFRAAGGRGMSYYDEFGPAVMAACGRGFANAVPSTIPALNAFLSEKTASFDCRDLGEQPLVAPLDGFQSATRNLMLAATAIWRVTGISWASLDTLAAVLFGVSLTAAYAVMRFVIPRWLAVFGTCVWAVSPMHLANLPHLRDYSKAPFFVLTALAMGAAIRAEVPRTLVALGVAFGIAQGIGFGMRTDVALNFLPFFLILFTLGSGAVNKNVKWKAAAAAATLMAFTIVALPVLNGYRRSEGLWHVQLLGLTTPFDSALNVRPAPYEFGYLYDDSYMSTVVQAYWFRVHGVVQGSLHNAGLYDVASSEYYRLFMTTFPGDFLTRMTGSALHVLNLPFSISYGIVPLGITSEELTWLSKMRAWVMLALAGAGPTMAALLLVLIGMRDRSAAAVGFAVLWFWGAYPYLQFQGRHVFHLEVLMIVVVLWAVFLATRLVSETRATSAWRDAARHALKSFAVVAAFCCLIVGAVVVARVVQQPRARAVLARYANSSRAPLVAQEVQASNTLTRLNVSLFEATGMRARIQQAMLLVEFSPGCGARQIPVHVRYQTVAAAELDFSRDVTVVAPTSAGSVLVFVPVYSIETADGGLSRFAGIDVPEASTPCIRLSRAIDAERSPLLLNAALASDWQTQPLHQRLYIGPVLPERLWLRLARQWPRIAGLG